MAEFKVVYNLIPELTAVVHEGKTEVLRDVTQRMEDDAKSRLHPGSFGYETGKARDSIQGVVTSESTAELRGGGDEAPYFAYNEFGTRYRAAAPSLVPATEKYKAEFPIEIGKLVVLFPAPKATI